MEQFFVVEGKRQKNGPKNGAKSLEDGWFLREDQAGSCGTSAPFSS